ncbi:hypothetical protein B0H17DRAFT_1211156 [Mycena rosella]|uniref:Uncharacterized protein n=1 Tax=Mycena rosella TaxID=1033263 RepID=A0AAD7G801_MYCRO|nr:hypothetical protein B0H17DRAFT_1211156 [Mycena rosella]
MDGAAETPLTSNTILQQLMEVLPSYLPLLPAQPQIHSTHSPVANDTLNPCLANSAVPCLSPTSLFFNDLFLLEPNPLNDSFFSDSFLNDSFLPESDPLFLPESNPSNNSFFNNLFLSESDPSNDSFFNNLFLPKSNFPSNDSFLLANTHASPHNYEFDSLFCHLAASPTDGLYLAHSVLAFWNEPKRPAVTRQQHIIPMLRYEQQELIRKLHVAVTAGWVPYPV